MTLSHLHIEDLAGIPMIGIQERSIKGGHLFLKRAMDIVLSSLILILLCPLFLLIAVAIKLDSRGPVVLRQIRVGKGERLFTCFKFRSMRENADAEKAQLLERNEANGVWFKMRNDPRVTNVGRLLRRFSMDELPQFLNVLMGHMSMVGPRPAVPAEVQRYQPWHRRRLEVAPGITGLWQVSGRSNLSFDEAVLLDLYYIENWSLLLDLQLLLRTVPRIISGEGAY